MAKEPKTYKAYSLKDHTEFIEKAADADDDIDYEKFWKIYQETTEIIKTGIQKIQKRLQEVRFDENVLLVQDKSMKRTINEFSDTLPEIQNAILQSLMEVLNEFLKKHDEKQTEFNEEAQKQAENKRDNYDASLKTD